MIEHFDERLGWHVHETEGDPCAESPAPAQRPGGPSVGVATLSAGVFEAHVEAMQYLAGMSWDVLSDVQIATLTELGIDRHGWALRFGHQLFMIDSARRHPPATLREAERRGLNWPRDLDQLLDAYVRQLHGQTRSDGADRMAQAAATLSYLDGVWERGDAEVGADDPMWRALNEPLHVERDDATPFDGLISWLWPRGDYIEIGPFRLAGGMELAALFIIVIVLWVPLTLANTWRLVVLRIPSAWLVIKVAIGWLVVIAAIGAFLRTPET